MEIEKFQSLVDKYLSGHTTAEEDAALRSCLESEDVSRAFDEYAFEKWQNAGSEMPKGVKDEIRRKLLTEIKSQRECTGSDSLNIWPGLPALPSLWWPDSLQERE